jgi:hypothetical protein
MMLGGVAVATYMASLALTIEKLNKNPVHEKLALKP